MEVLPRRSISEIIALHELERTCEVYVEGPSDKNIIEWFLAENDLDKVAVLEISTVEISKEMTDRIAVENNNRGRLIALAAALNSEDSTRGTVTCIVDSDFDWILNVRHDYTTLLTTDFTSMEMYAFNERTIRKLLKLVIQGFPRSAAMVLSDISNMLQDLFLIRLVSYTEGAKLRMIHFRKSSKLSKKRVKFDRTKYLTDLLRANSALGLRGQLEQRIKEFSAGSRPDARFQIHGHDFVNVLTWYIREHSNFGGLSPDVIERALIGVIEKSDLMGHDLFKRLLLRCRAALEPIC